MKSIGTTLATALVALVGGCTDAVTPTADPTLLLSVSPAGGAVQVDVDTAVTITFSHAMAPNMEMYAALHEGDGVTGPIVDGTWTWSSDRTRLTFTPATDLRPATTYSLHLGGGMTDMNDHVADLETHGRDLGGAWVTQHMMDERTMGGMHGETMENMTGPGWEHENGTYGMVFTFTTE